MKEQYEVFMLALCLWKEARGRQQEEIVAVACSIRNRLLAKFRGANSFSEVVTARAQYSSYPWINDKNQPVMDQNGTKFPHVGRPEWDRFEVCMGIAADVAAGRTADTVAGATHYFDKSLDANPPAWAKDPASRHTVNVGDFRFYVAR